MDTKAKGDIAEQAAILKAMRLGWVVLKPIGDRLPYDMVFQIGDKFAKIQVKLAWFCERNSNYLVDTRRMKTNRRVMKVEKYKLGDFDFALAYVEQEDEFYVFPFSVFASYASQICLQPCVDRQRKAKSVEYRDNWQLINKWALPEGILEVASVKVGEAVDMVIPSQAARAEGVET